MNPFDLLYVCTGNICRSPMAELYTLAVLAERLGDAAGRFRVHSAGTYGLEGRPIEPNAARSLAGYGVLSEQFRARRIAVDLIRGADLVLTMTREHRADVVREVPGAAGRTFTLREFARLAAAVDPAELPEGGDPADRARHVVAAVAARRGTIPSAGEDDVADPFGEPPEVYRRCVEEIVDALRVPLLLLTGRDGS